MLGFTKDRLPNEFFHKSNDLVGSGGRTTLPDIDDVVVFHAEAELAFVIGSEVQDVSAGDAMGKVFGFVPFFDISARGLHRRGQFIPKGQRGFALCGPWITTADEIHDPHELRVRSWLNGVIAQDFSTNTMANRIPEQIEWLSRFTTLHAGDLVTTGTNHEGLKPINVGDSLEIEIEGLGRARFGVDGSSPHKTAAFVPGQTSVKPLEKGMLISRVD
ncbi:MULTISPECIES: fumarylacetoacetate hydrolase family protein [Devosiaceae]|uniref:Fumarylacetoacetate hydrolase family protein n=1 Tax=Devosia salina TaxID=2860336 RepID=A0ABX8WPK5_9HYPH|nr:fumarylacetoacetate hydrolase family protein [Pelagibacterium sp. 26DY04]MAN86862.1 hypothetical protein [Algoriphagus sp.]QYO78937.1 fumarylacetoacetate hydrolase family protein [Devosia salina]